MEEAVNLNKSKGAKGLNFPVYCNLKRCCLAIAFTMWIFEEIGKITGPVKPSSTEEYRQFKQHNALSG